MDSFEWNKIIGAVLFSALLLMVISEVGNILVSPESVASPMEVEDGAGHGGQVAKAEEPKPLEPVAPLLASADVAAGESYVSKRCTACHSFEKGGPNKVGPDLYGVVGRPKAHREGFSYSSAMQDKGGEWTYADLNHFLHKPKDFVPGTKMAFAGIKDVQDRADVIAYLRTLNDNPPPLPSSE
jgi:cytochrome c